MNRWGRLRVPGSEGGELDLLSSPSPLDLQHGDRPPPLLHWICSMEIEIKAKSIGLGLGTGREGNLLHWSFVAGCTAARGPGPCRSRGARCHPGCKLLPWSWVTADLGPRHLPGCTSLPQDHAAAWDQGYGVSGGRCSSGPRRARWVRHRS
jgi:hypothetical protein